MDVDAAKAATVRDNLPPENRNASPDAALATSLTRLWPHREHESNALQSMLCRAGFHRWQKLDLREIAPAKDVSFCSRCSKVRIDGVLYKP